MTLNKTFFGLLIFFSLVFISCCQIKKNEKQFFEILESKTIVTFIDKDEYHLEPNIRFNLVIRNNSDKSLFIDPYNILFSNDTINFLTETYIYDRNKLEIVNEEFEIAPNSEKKLIVGSHILSFTNYAQIEKMLNFYSNYRLKFYIKNELDIKTNYFFLIKDFYKNIEYKYYDSIIPANELYKYRKFNIFKPIYPEQLPPSYYN